MKTNLNIGTTFSLNAPNPNCSLEAAESPQPFLCLQRHIHQQVSSYVQSTCVLHFLLTGILIVFSSVNRWQDFYFKARSAALLHAFMFQHCSRLFTEVGSWFPYLNLLKLLGCYIVKGEWEIKRKNINMKYMNKEAAFKLTVLAILDILPNKKEKWKLNLRTELFKTKQFYHSQFASRVCTDGPKDICHYQSRQLKSISSLKETCSPQ